MKKILLGSLVAAWCWAGLVSVASAQWVAYHDHRPGSQTGANVSTFDLLGGSSGSLIDHDTGAQLPVTVAVTATGSPRDYTASGYPNPGTPAYNTFNGIVDLGNNGIVGVSDASGESITLTFNNLDPNKRYIFTGTSVRNGTGANNYAFRWTVCTIQGAVEFTEAHTAGCITNGYPGGSLNVGQAAYGSGVNTSGEMVVWEEINPGPDGSFSVKSEQYLGVIPGGTANATDKYGYAITGFRLEEYNPVPIPATITDQPQSQAVGELQPVTFTVGAEGNPTPTYQWYKNGAIIPGATADSYTIARAPLSDHHAVFTVVIENTVSNVLHSVTSSPAVLTVLADTTPPALVGAQALGLSQVQVSFSERVAALTATNVANYAVTSAVTGSLTIHSAALDASETNVLLTVDLLTEDVTYKVVVNNVTDPSAAANPIAPNSQATFVAVSYAPQDIGNPAIPGTAVAVPGGFNITAGGTGIGGTSDQLFLSYQSRSGNFDQAVRVATVTAGEFWAKAGLMARENLTGPARFAAILATPTAAGTLFESRTATGADSTIAGNFPVNYPDTWLRLRRTGNTFTGYTSYDGQSWYQVGSVVLALPSTVFFGMVASSHDAATAMTAQFRDLENTENPTAATGQPPLEPIGPSSRKTGLAITEIMYNPAGPGSYTNSTEFIELYNSNPWFEEIGNYRISGDVDYTFPPDTVIPGGGFMIIARNPSVITGTYGLTNVLGPWDGAATNSLPNDAGRVRLRNDRGAIYLEIEYEDNAPWPMGADNTGHSIVLSRPSYGENNPRAWSRSDQKGGSPGRVDGLGGWPLRHVVINEFLAHTDPPLEDYVELYNHSNGSVDISGCTLSDSPKTNKYVFPPNSILPPRGFLVVTQAQLGFGLSSGGETIYFGSPDGTRVLDAVRYEAQANGRASGRYPDGYPEFYPLQTLTAGTNNLATDIFIDDIVINEIMFDSVAADSDDEYVELYNRGAASVNLSGWRFTDGIDYQFDHGTTLGAGQYLVIAKDKARLLSRYPQLNNANTLGNFNGTLANGGERLALGMPDYNFTTNNQGIVHTSVVYVVVSEVTYGTGERWGKWANEGGSSLELKDPRANPRLAGNWAGSDETGKAIWITIEATGNMDNGSADAPNMLEVYMNGAGECLMDNVEVFVTEGNNLIPNSDFETGMAGWTPRGTQERSTLETTEGDSSAQSLHIRASARGDYGANRILAQLTSTPPQSGPITIRGRFRWLAGFPEVVMRLHGNWMEATGPLLPPGFIPPLGTPGQVNSRAATNPGPAIADVRHNPVVPDAGEAVVVTARVQDPDGLGAVELLYRIDPQPAYTTVAMLDNGTGGDAVAGDGMFSATIPGQSSGVLVAFYVQAEDAAQPPAGSQFPEGASPLGREGLVRFGEEKPWGAFFAYRQWLTQRAVNQWINRAVLSNEPIEGTFVYGQWRAVYNMGSRYAGSPYHQGFNSPTGNNCHYSIGLPRDDKVLGTENFNKIHGPGNGSFGDCTLQREQAAYWIARQAGLPWLYRRFVVMYVNGVKRGTAGRYLMEDMQTPNGDVIEENWPKDKDGQLYKLQPWFEMNDSAAGSMAFNNRSWCTMNRYLTTYNGVPGVHKLARYRVNYLTRAAHGTANDYTNVFHLVEAANTYNQGVDNYMANMNAIVDTEQWIRTFAVEHACGNWDSFGNRNAQNMYGYKPENGPWELIIFDFNIVLNSGGCGTGSDGPGAQLFRYQNADAAMPYLYHNNQVPAFRRAFWRAMKDLIRGPLDPNRINPMLDAKYNAMIEHGHNATAPNGIKSFVSSARSSIQSQMASQDTANFTINGPGIVTVSDNQVTLTGLAPVEIATLKVNGNLYPLTWTSTTAWRVVIPLSAASTVLNFQGEDYFGKPVAGASGSVTVNYTGQYPQDIDEIVINEIMFNPLVAGAEYMELYNTSTQYSFDLSGWRINGLDYTFPEGAFIAPRQYLVLARNQQAFHNAYGTGVTVYDEYAGNLQRNGETLTLERPVLEGSNLVYVTVDKVKYEPNRPWPVGADDQVTASSIQLKDVTQDNSRPLNWRTQYAPAVWSDPVFTPAITNEGWVFVSYTGEPGRDGQMKFWIDNPGTVYLDDVALVEGTEPEAGVNLLQNADLETGAAGPWAVLSPGTIAVSSAAAHTGNFGLVYTASAGGSSERFYQNTSGIQAGTTYTLSFWFFTTAEPNVLNYHLQSAYRTGIPGNDPINIQRNIIPPRYTPAQLISPAVLDFTPGAANTGRANLIPIPPLWLNEVQVNHTDGLTDSAGEHDPWIELYNAGLSAVSLDGFYLADNFTNLTQWAFPAGASIAPGQFQVIFADGQPGQSTASEWHTSFRLNGATGSVALARGSVVHEVLDYIHYANIRTNESYGAYLDGQPFNKLEFYYATPGGTNDASPPPVQLYLNEWMAANNGFLLDPADGQADDWFEIYNASPFDVNLAGYFLTDTTNNPTKYRVPEGYSVPGHGFLLVWADEDTIQNSPASPDLHVNFKLRANGEQIALASPTAVQLDLVVFTNQLPNVSQGRYPDGAPPVYPYMQTPTPRASNVTSGGNTPPALNPIPDQIITLGQTLAFTATATDPDVPPQSLAFALEPGAPAGAMISVAGDFTWTPTAGQAPGPHAITVGVRDSATPPGSDTQTFNVTIAQPPATTITLPGGGQVTLEFNVVSGRAYRVEYTDSLATPITWTPLPAANPVTASGSVLTVNDTLNATGQRFYRIVVLD